MVGLLGAEGVPAAASGAGWFVEHAWLIALLPFISAALTLFFGKRTPGGGPVYGIAALGAGFVMALGVAWHFVQGGGPYEKYVEWFRIGSLHMQLGFYVDGLTAVMLIVVTFVSLMVHIYSLGYMHGDVRYTWFFVVLSLFTGAMLDVVLAGNLFQLLVGWEVMGVCSYLLIGHWYEDPANSGAAIKAFITTRVGDVPFMFGIFALIFATGMTTSNIQVIGETISAGHVSSLLVTAAALLLFGGTIGKSAQFPLYVWLPDAMAGPTPVSALIHAATMVAAGIYLVARTFQVFVSADPIALHVVAIIGAITLLLAAFLALVQDDIKKVLAYSTISQLAYMVAALGVGPDGYPAAMFHLFTHAFFKALLFLGAGSVIHAVHSNNMSEMGGLRKDMRVTFWTFADRIGRARGGTAVLGVLLEGRDHPGRQGLAHVLAGRRAAARCGPDRLLHHADGPAHVLRRLPGARACARVAPGDDRPAHPARRCDLRRRAARLRATGSAVPRLGVLRRRADPGHLQSAGRAPLDRRGRDRDLGRVRPVPALAHAGSDHPAGAGVRACSSTSITSTTCTGTGSSARSGTRSPRRSTGTTST